MLASTHSGGSIASSLNMTCVPSEVVQKYLLPHLTPESLAALRSTCQSYQQAVDDAPASCVAQVVANMLPAGLLQHARSGSDVQRLFRSQPSWVAHVRSGAPYQTHSLPTTGHDTIVSWAPEPAEPQLVVVSVPKRAYHHVQLEKFSCQHLEWDPSNQPGSETAATALMKPSCALPRLQVVSPDGKALGIKAVRDIRRVELYPSPKPLPKWFRPALGDDFWHPHWCSTGFHLAVHHWDRHGMTLAVCDLSLMDDQPDPSVFCSHHFSKPELGAALSPNRDCALVCLRGSPQHVTALQLPTLSQQYSISAGPAHMAANADLQPCWMAYAPDGLHFAVVWAHAHEATKDYALVQSLTIHAARNGALQAQINLQNMLPGMKANLAPEHTHAPFIWSPSSLCLSITWAFSFRHEPGAHAIIFLDGECHVLPLLHISDRAKTARFISVPRWTWSACGRFFSYTCATSSDPDHELDGAAIPLDADLGCIWEVASRQPLHTWREPYFRGEIVWAPSAPMCYIWSQHVVLVMPGNPGDALVQISVEGLRPWPASGLQETWQFSPCSQVLLACWPASHSLFHVRRPGTSVLHHWHGWIDPHQPICHLSVNVNQSQPSRQGWKAPLSRKRNPLHLPSFIKYNDERRERALDKLLLPMEARRHEVLQLHDPSLFKNGGDKIWFSQHADLAWSHSASVLALVSPDAVKLTRFGSVL